MEATEQAQVYEEAIKSIQEVGSYTGSIQAETGGPCCLLGHLWRARHNDEPAEWYWSPEGVAGYDHPAYEEAEEYSILLDTINGAKLEYATWILEWQRDPHEILYGFNDSVVFGDPDQLTRILRRAAERAKESVNA